MNFNTKKASEYLRSLGFPFTAGTLSVWRVKDKGPKYKRVAGRIFYEKTALDDFAKGVSV